jgi:hypothetical protein
VLDRLTVSSSAPKIVLGTRLQALASATRRVLAVVWTGHAAPGHHLVFTLIGSYDGGRSWSPAVIEQPSGDIHLLVSRNRHLLLELIASDGTRSVVVKRTLSIP